MIWISRGLSRTPGGLGGLFLVLLASGVSAEDQAPGGSAHLVVQDGHTIVVPRVVVSPDGKLILTGGDTTARLWDVRTGKQLRTFQGHTAPVVCAAFSPDGTCVLTAGIDGTAKLWDVQTGKRLHDLQGHTGGVAGAAFSPDGKRILTGSMDRTARLWDAGTGKTIHELKGHTDQVWRVAFSPDGTRALTGGQDKTARVWDVQTGQSLHTLSGHTDTVASVAFGPDSKLVLTGSKDNTARLWDAGNGKPLHTLSGHTDWVWSVAFSPDGKHVLTGSRDRTALLWDTGSGKLLHTLEGHAGSVWSVAFSPDSKSVLTGSQDQTARLWDVPTGQVGPILRGHTASVTHVTFSPDGKRALTSATDSTARLWDVATGKPGAILQGQVFQLSNVSFSPDGKFSLASSEDHTAMLWDLQAGKPGLVFRGHQALVTSAVFSPDGKFVLTASSDKTARLWDVRTGKTLHTFEHPAVVDSAVFSADGKLVLTTSKEDKTARLWDARTGMLLHTLEHPDLLYSAAFSADGKRVLTGSKDKLARLWDVRTGKVIRTLSGHTGLVTNVAFSPDGKLALTSGQDKTARLWDLRTGKARHVLQGHTRAVESLIFSPDGKRILTGSWDHTAQLWDVETGKQIKLLDGHTDAVLRLVYSPDGKRFLTGGRDTLAQLWDATTNERISRLEGHAFSVNSMAFSPDGKVILTAGGKTPMLWDGTDGKQLCRLVRFKDQAWAVVDEDGRFDASNGGDVEGLHWVVGLEPIALNQLKERYYDPGLLAKILGFNKEPLRDVHALKDVKLFPSIAVAQKGGQAQFDVTLSNRGGGIGKVVVLINGKEFNEDARPRGVNDANAPKLDLRLDLSGDPRLVRGRTNTVEVLAYNAEGYLCSRGMQALFAVEGQQDKDPPQLWGIVAGVSKYANPTLELRYAAKDAEDFATALEVASIRLFGKDKVRLTLLTTAQTAAERQPTRQNLVNALEAAHKAKPGDVVVIYLAGHGVNHGGQDGDYFYLTRDAASADLKDPEVRRRAALSSAELTELLKAIPAQKQVLILDTCASAKAVEKLTEKRDVPGSQVRALERVKDRTGLHILAGCAADAVSYEATRYGQGVLTYSLLLGMRGAKLREGEYVDVVELFGYASDKVPELAHDIGGVQRPVIASPRGGSFDIGRVMAADQEKIPLQKVRPVVLRAIVQEEARARDSLELTKRVNERLRSASAGRGAALVFVDATEFPGAVEVGGRYKVAGNKVTVSVNLFVGDKEFASFNVEGDKDKPDDLAGRLVAEIEKRLAGQ